MTKLLSVIYKISYFLKLLDTAEFVTLSCTFFVLLHFYTFTLFSLTLSVAGALHKALSAS